MSTISAVNSSSSSDIWANMKTQRSQMQAKMFAKVDTDSSGGVDKTELQSMLDDVAKKTGVANSASTDQIFSKMDANSDGSLSADELDKGMKDILPQPSTMDFAQSRTSSSTKATSSQGDGDGDDLFSKIDTDGNGSVSKEELQSLMSKMATDNSSSATTSSSSTSSNDLFAKLDTNSDGSLSQTEFDAGRTQNNSTTQASQASQEAGGAPPPPPPGGAGGASSASSTTTTYDPLDTNQDGTVSLAERMAGNKSTDAVQTLLKAMDTDGDKKISSSESDAFIAKLTTQIESLNQSGQSTSASTTSASSQSNTDLVNLVQQAYEQIANGLTQQTKGSSLSAVA